MTGHGETARAGVGFRPFTPVAAPGLSVPMLGPRLTLFAREPAREAASAWMPESLNSRCCCGLSGVSGSVCVADKDMIDERKVEDIRRLRLCGAGTRRASRSVVGGRSRGAARAASSAGGRGKHRCSSKHEEQQPTVNVFSAFCWFATVESCWCSALFTADAALSSLLTALSTLCCALSAPCAGVSP